MGHFIYDLVNTYPQISIPIKEGISKTEEYRNIVLRGEKSPYPITFFLDNRDSFETFKTKMGEVNIITMYKRDDFVHMIRCLGGKCEPIEIPDSTGAMAIFGLNNWDKVRQGLDDYKDSIIILSSGNYSNVTSEDVKKVTDGEIDLSKEEWIEKSIIIRKYHELTHFVMRKEYPNDIKAIRDELIADMVGLIKAFGFYDSRLAKLFLGIESKDYRKGGRLENYSENYLVEIPHILDMISKLEVLNKNNTFKEILDNIGLYMDI